MSKELTLPDLIRKYAIFELIIDEDYKLHRYELLMDWVDSKKYMIFVDIMDKALEEVSFDITKKQVDKMIDKFIEKLESL